MKRPQQIIERSYPMMIAAYWLSRCGAPRPGKGSSPPAALGVGTWSAAYDSFFDVMGDGRTPAQFRNSLKNARDAFDILFDNGRIGWVDQDGKQPSLSASFQRVDDEWRRRTDNELEEFLFGLMAEMATVADRVTFESEVRTEGGETVYISIRRERDPKLREEAIAIHGLDCMACGFNFESTYGDLGSGFIEVHHIVPLANAGRSETNPETDLIVLCANCHRMVHRRRDLCLTIGELKSHLRTTNPV